MVLQAVPKLNVTVTKKIMRFNLFFSRTLEKQKWIYQIIRYQMDSSLFLLLLPNNIISNDESWYKLIDSSTLQEIFHLSQNVNHADECRINIKVEIS